jgi:hypothetical protein
MIDLEKKILFVHIPKCAGTFIEDNLTPNIDWHQRGEKHLSLQNCISVYGENVVTNCFRFSVIRNPYSRLLSFYLYHKRLKSELFLLSTVARYAKAFKKNYYSNFADFIFNLKHYYSALEGWAKNDISPCHDFLISYQGIGVDMVLKQEALSEELEKLGLKTGISFHNERVNSSPNKYNIQDYYLQNEIDFVMEFYKIDFFHYYPKFNIK